MAVAVIGAAGCIGREVVRALRLCEIVVYACGTKSGRTDIKVDLTDRATWTNLPRDVSAVVICAGLGDLRQCRLMPQAMSAVNLSGTSAFASHLARQDIFSVTLSTNYVFDGLRADYGPKDLPRPVCAYGRQKAEMERAVATESSAGRAAIVRLTKVLSGQNRLLQFWGASLVSGKPVVAACDARAAFLSPGFVAESLTSIVSTQSAGLWQLSACDDLSWLEVAGATAAALNAPADLVRGKKLIEIDPETEFTPMHGTLASAWPTTMEAPSSKLAVRRALDSICARP